MSKQQPFYATFVEAIPELSAILGISNATYLIGGANHAEEQGFPEAAKYLKGWSDSFKGHIQEEWNVGSAEIRDCSVGGQNCFCRTDGVG